MLFRFVAFPCMHYSQRYEASNTKGWDLEKWVPASLRVSLSQLLILQPGGDTPIHYLYGYVPPNGVDLKAPDLERGIHFRGVF